MFKLKIPATTANMGPGFDTLGMSLSLYLNCDVSLNICNEIMSNIETIDLNFETNLISRTFLWVIKQKSLDVDVPKIKIDINSEIPLSSGLGSSASAIVAGILIANVVMELKLSIDEMIDLAVMVEGHPDNVVPCIVGGMVVSCVEKNENKVYWSKVKSFPEYIGIIAVIPEYNLSTDFSRGLLPNTYKRSDVVFNLQRLSLLIAGNNNEHSKERYINNLKIALNDKIHQPFRMEYISGFEEILKYDEIIGAFISGAGPTIIVLYEKANVVNVMKKLKNLDKLDKLEIRGVDIGVGAEVINDDF